MIGDNSAHWIAISALYTSPLVVSFFHAAKTTDVKEAREELGLQ